MFKGLGNIASMLKQAQSMGGKMSELAERMKAERVTGSAAGGMLQVVCTGSGEVVSVTIEPSLVEKQEGEMIQDLLPAAINDALGKARALNAQAMQEITGGMNIPGLDEMMDKLTPPNS